MKCHSTIPALALGAAAACAVATSGCATARPPEASPAVSSSAPTTPTTPDEETSALGEYHRYHHGGVARFLALSLDTLGASPQQRDVIERIRVDLRRELEPTSSAEAALLTTLADELGRPNVDVARVDAAAAAVANTVATRRDSIVGSLIQLHDVLTPEQRGALVDKVESHLTVWQQQNVDEAAPDRKDGHLAALSVELGLTEPQTASIRAALDARGKGAAPFNRDQAAADLRAFAEAFRRASFDTHAAEPLFDGRVSTWGSAHLASVVETMAPILTYDQRTLLAEKLRAHAADVAAGGAS